MAYKIRLQLPATKRWLRHLARSAVARYDFANGAPEVGATLDLRDARLPLHPCA